MNKIIAICGLFFLSISLCFSQEENKTIRPLLLDKSVLSGVGLQKIDIKDEPEKDFFQKQLYRGQDISIYVVSTETWNNKMENFPFDEFIYMYHGEAIVKPKKGQAQIFYTGDYFFAPKGYTGEWEIKAGTNFHYELSVIATRRSREVDSTASHLLFNRSKLSAAHIEFDAKGQYEELLQPGVELSIHLKAEKPQSKKLSDPGNEMMIHLLSGQLELIDSDGEKQIFYSGDFFVLPKGFTGDWKSEGHGIIKYLTVQRTK